MDCNVFRDDFDFHSQKYRCGFGNALLCLCFVGSQERASGLLHKSDRFVFRRLCLTCSDFRKPLNQFGCPFRYIHTSVHGVDMQNLI